MAGYCAEASQLGITDPAAIRQYAANQVEADVALGRLDAGSTQATGTQPAPSAAATPTPPLNNGPQKRKLFRDRAARQTNRAGTVQRTPEEPNQNPEATLPEMSTEAMRKVGMLPSPTG
jgi:hypothetical protein